MNRIARNRKKAIVIFAIVLACVASSWFVIKLGQARKQARIVKIITEHGGAVVYDYQFTGSASEYTIRPDVTPPGPAWLNRLLGPDFFSSIVYINLSQTSIDDDDLTDFSVLKRLYILDLEYTQISDTGLNHLEDCPSLRRLEIGGTRISENGSKRFKAVHPQCVIS